MVELVAVTPPAPKKRRAVKSRLVSIWGSSRIIGTFICGSTMEDWNKCSGTLSEALEVPWTALYSVKVWRPTPRDAFHLTNAQKLWEDRGKLAHNQVPDVEHETVHSSMSTEGANAGLLDCSRR